ncbi:zinc finger BED domain-containing protein RICESLEEPER 2-like [Silene latifolia]|uniref:zinc finger BED domain-containing protein RICESLEEPER 2-like n=1 Tax=Silene latifolia TaxID=37657 RepID=UPI003D76E9BC
MEEDIPGSDDIQAAGMSCEKKSDNLVHLNEDRVYACDNDIDKRLPCGASSDNGGGNGDSSGDDSKSSRSPDVELDKIRRAMCNMVISDGLSLRTSERVGFKIFVASLCPHFNPPSPTDLVKDALNYYKEERKIVEDELQRAPGRICFTVDNMTDDIIEENCTCLTAHWIDCDWNLQKRMIKFETLITPFDEDYVCATIKSCLANWKISNKVLSFTVDKPFYRSSMMVSITTHLQKTNSMVLGGQLFHISCSHEIINLVVVAGLNLIEKVIDKIRSIVEHIRSFTSKKEKFYELARSSFGLDTSKRLIGDTDARWNSTFVMLDRFLYFRDVIDSFVSKDKNIKVFALKQEEWERVAEVFNFLKVLYDVMNTYLASKTQTPNVHFHVLWTVFRKLSDISNGPPSFLFTMAKELHLEFDKYWSDNCLVLSCAAVLDPRFKLERVEYCYEKLYGEEYAREMIGKVKTALFDMFVEYNKVVDKPNNVGYVARGYLEHDDYEDYVAFLSKRSKVEEKSELERYLEDWHSDMDKDTDVLAYWKNNSKRFPCLSCLARDILTVPISTVAWKSVFSTTKNFHCLWRKSIPLETPIVMEALVCYHDWVRARGLMKGSPFYGYNDDDVEEGSEDEFEENEDEDDDGDDEDEGEDGDDEDEDEEEDDEDCKED